MKSLGTLSVSSHNIKRHKYVIIKEMMQGKFLRTNLKDLYHIIKIQRWYMEERIKKSLRMPVTLIFAKETHQRILPRLITCVKYINGWEVFEFLTDSHLKRKMRTKSKVLSWTCLKSKSYMLRQNLGNAWRKTMMLLWDIIVIGRGGSKVQLINSATLYIDTHIK